MTKWGIRFLFPGPPNLCLNRPSWYSWYVLIFENQWKHQMRRKLRLYLAKFGITTQKDWGFQVMSLRIQARVNILEGKADKDIIPEFTGKKKQWGVLGSIRSWGNLIVGNSRGWHLVKTGVSQGKCRGEMTQIKGSCVEGRKLWEEMLGVLRNRIRKANRDSWARGEQWKMELTYGYQVSREG